MCQRLLLCGKHVNCSRPSLENDRPKESVPPDHAPRPQDTDKTGQVAAPLPRPCTDAPGRWSPPPPASQEAPLGPSAAKNAPKQSTPPSPPRRRPRTAGSVRQNHGRRAGHCRSTAAAAPAAPAAPAADIRNGFKPSGGCAVGRRSGDGGGVGAGAGGRRRRRPRAAAADGEGEYYPQAKLLGLSQMLEGVRRHHVHVGLRKGVPRCVRGGSSVGGRIRDMYGILVVLGVAWRRKGERKGGKEEREGKPCLGPIDAG